MEQATTGPSQLHMGCLPHTLVKGLYVMMGFDACSESYLAYVPCVLIGLLYLSVMTRYRDYALASRYKRRSSSPKIYARLTAVPWEALLAFILTLPRGCWALNTTINAVIKHGAWQYRDFTHWLCWALMLYFVLFDRIERRLFTDRLLKPYWDSKRRDTEVVDVNTMLLEGRQPPAATKSEYHDAEKSDFRGISPMKCTSTTRTWRQCLQATFKTPKARPTAVYVLAQYHILAFIKVSFSFIFLSDMGLSACQGELKYLLNSQHSITPVMFIISGLSLGRFAQLAVEGWVFSTEVDWKALEQERRGSNVECAAEAGA